MRAPIFTILAATLLSAAPAAAQGRQDFTLVNRTGYDISEVYVSPTKSNDWEEDVMGRDILEAGASVDIGFSKRDRNCIYDIKVVYTDSDEAEWDRFDLCTISRIELFYDRKKDETWAEWE